MLKSLYVVTCYICLVYQVSSNFHRPSITFSAAKLFLEQQTVSTSTIMAPSDDAEALSEDSPSSSEASDMEQPEIQVRAPKRRRLSESSDDSHTAPVPLPTLSRIKKKDTNPKKPETTEEEDPVTIRDALEIGLRSEESTFSSLDVAPWLVGSLTTMAIRRPTAIQKACIPEILKGRDCIGGSRTGSGKTIAFGVPILQKWAKDPFGIFAVVLTPTRYGFDVTLVCGNIGANFFFLLTVNLHSRSSNSSRLFPPRRV